MIVDVTFPSNITKVNYGALQMQPDQNFQLQVPDYVAKTLLTLSGVTGPTLSATAATLLAAADADYEGNYLLQAYGQPRPAPGGAIAAATAVMTARGAPTVSMN